MITTWLANDGGPLLAVDSVAAVGWQGTDSDYARACAAAYPAGRIDFGETWGVVIGAQEGVAAAGWWHPSGSSLYFLIGTVFGDEATDHRVAALLASDAVTDWTHLGLVRIDSGRLMLLHAASHGAEVVVDPQRNPAVIGDALTVAVPRGEYAVASAEVKIKDAGLYCVVRWAPALEFGQPDV